MTRYILTALVAMILTLPAMGQADDGDSTAHVAKARQQRTDQVLTGHQGDIQTLQQQMQQVLGVVDDLKRDNESKDLKIVELERQLEEAQTTPATVTPNPKTEADLAELDSYLPDEGMTGIEILCANHIDHPQCRDQAPAAPTQPVVATAPASGTAPSVWHQNGTAQSVVREMTREQAAMQLLADYDVSQLSLVTGMADYGYADTTLFDVMSPELCGDYGRSGRRWADTLAEYAVLGSDLYGCTGGSRPADWNKNRLQSVTFDNTIRSGYRCRL